MARACTTIARIAGGGGTRVAIQQPCSRRAPLALMAPSAPPPAPPTQPASPFPPGAGRSTRSSGCCMRRGTASRAPTCWSALWAQRWGDAAHPPASPEAASRRHRPGGDHVWVARLGCGSLDGPPNSRPPAPPGRQVYNYAGAGEWAEDAGWTARLDQGWSLTVVRDAAYAALAEVRRGVPGPGLQAGVRGELSAAAPPASGASRAAHSRRPCSPAQADQAACQSVACP